MQLRPNFSKHWPILKETQQAFPSKILFLHGKSARMVDPGTQSKDIQITKLCFLISVLRNSAISRSLRTGKMAHASILRTGYESNMFLANNLLHLYCCSGSISNALQLFSKMCDRDVVSWNTMISGFVANGFFGEAFCSYGEMKHAGIHPSQSSFASILVASVRMGCLENCRKIHGESLKRGFTFDVLVGNALLTAYVKCGDIIDSRKVFDGIHNLDEVSFEILFGGYLRLGNLYDAFELFRYSCLIEVPFSHFSLSSIISLCASTGLIDQCVQIHGYGVKVGLESDVSIVNSLITMYARSYRLDDAVCLFEGLRSHDIVSWNSLIGGYALNSQGDAGVDLVARFLSFGMRINESTFSSFLSSCATVTILETAKKAHVLILKLREPTDQGTSNIILTMYCRCKSINDVINAFKMMEERDFISFNILIGLFRDLSRYEEAIGLFLQIQLEGFNVDELMYSSLISSCSKLADLDSGLQIHTCIIKTGFEKVFPLGNSLLEMYSQCRRLNDMEKMFSEIDMPDIFTWNTMAIGYAHFGFFDLSIRIWKEMIESGIELNEFSYCAMIDMCICIEDPVIGEQIQGRIKKLGLVSDTALMNSLLTMYASCGMMDKASTIFAEISSTDSVSWNAIVCGYAQNGLAEESLRVYLLMNQSGLKPNHMTFASISKSCIVRMELVLGLQFHGQVIKRGFESDVLVSNSFITMYAKCGDIRESSKIFLDTMTNRDVITWNSMICGYAHHGCGREALDTFSEMKVSGEKPNGVTFLGVLSACSHTGLLSEARIEFNAMYQDHGILPSEEHYTCMVDILCRAGNLREAKDFIERMPFNPCSLIWRTLLSACRTNENIELGEEVAEKLMKLEPQDSSAYILLSNIYASVDKMEKKAEMRRRMKNRNVKKETGYSWIRI
ncbi:hypothetical protein HHK36_004513 [Tetracentron sinense]|uniref:Pentatricopeptide repeat-containing protein n=1 Tax=Tetracentron sinense TaxID=13715 RepID=A0A834ZV20_TETSI|nr:hypothetical protein HHK36_004513 [Tetracentron sinense]